MRARVAPWGHRLGARLGSHGVTGGSSAQRGDVGTHPTMLSPALQGAGTTAVGALAQGG